MKTIPFNQLDFRQLPLERVVKSLPHKHPLFKVFKEYRQQIHELVEEGNDQAVAVAHITMALQLAAFEN